MAEGWRVEQLLRSKPEWQPGLLEEADGRMLYIDEVNLLDDQIANLILDVASTGYLVVQRDGHREEKVVRFSLVGTMNPEKGGLRAQLLDRFGLVVPVEGETSDETRKEILRARLRFDAADNDLRAEAAEKDQALAAELGKVRATAADTDIPDAVLAAAIAVARRFEVEGHRAELTLALAARALAARQRRVPTPADVAAVARLALPHRRKDVAADRPVWDRDADQKKVEEALQ